MYQSRYHATNGIVSIAIDARSGELLEFVNERTGDNIIKSNCHPLAWHPFVIEAKIDGKTVSGRCLRYLEILEDADRMAKIAVDQRETSAAVRIDYNYAFFDGTTLPIKTHVEIELPENSCLTKWNIRVVPDGEHVVERVHFPSVNGIWLGENYEDNILMYPRQAGIKIKNPVYEMAKPSRKIYWKWQEYRYTYSLDSTGARKDDRNAYILEAPYTGGLSMLYMDMYNPAENSGFYMTCRDNDFRLTDLRAETFGEEYPGMGFAVVHNVFSRDKEFASHECIIALHEGDWHWAADEYRSWRETLPCRTEKKHRPEWFEKSPGLVAHYDFKYQTHGICHTYKDIPALLDQAREMGFDHILLSGWNYDGFDYGYPEYRTDPDLGTEEDLRNAVKTVRDRGGHVAFYCNSRLCNTVYKHSEKLIRDSAVMQKDGSLLIERSGRPDLEFATLCNQSPEWRNKFVNDVKWLSDDIGADSMYLDEVAMGTGTLCFHPGHEHKDEPYRWNNGYIKMLDAMRANYGEDGLAMLYEGCSDILGYGVSGQLISTIFFPFACPEMYKYTFPDQILVDMMNPRRNSGMRAEIAARKSTFLLYRAFVTGSYLWVYDLEYDNTFRRDPEQLNRLKSVAALRRKWLECYGQGKFIDDIDISTAEGISVKEYEIGGGRLLACANEKRIKNARITVKTNGKHYKAAVRTYSKPDEEAEQDTRCIDDDHILVTMPDNEELAVIVLREV